MIRQIQYFQAIVKYQSFTKAADELFISQSAISQQIKSLETDLGVKLLVRKNRTFELTEAGGYFYRHSMKLLQSFKQLKKNTQKIAMDQKKTLKIGYLKGDATIFLQKAIAQFHSLYPEIQLEFESGTHEQLYRQLIEGCLDLVLSDQRRAFSSAYVNRILKTRCTYVVLPSLHPLALRETLNKEDLSELTCLIVTGSDPDDQEKDFIHEILEIEGNCEIVPNLEEAYLMLFSKPSFLLIEQDRPLPLDPMLKAVLYLRKGEPVRRLYCAFWKREVDDPYYERLAELIEAQ